MGTVNFSGDKADNKEALNRFDAVRIVYNALINNNNNFSYDTTRILSPVILLYTTRGSSDNPENLFFLSASPALVIKRGCFCNERV